MNKIYSKLMKTRHFVNLFALVLIFLGVTSCNDEDISLITGISVSPVEKGVILVGSIVEFNVRGNNSTDITDESVIKVDGVELTDNTFTTESDPKTYNVQVSYKEFTDEIIIETGKGFAKNVLIEDYTGTWCVNCPRLSWAIELAKNAAPEKVISVGIHNFDEMQMDGVEVLIDEFNVVSYPTGIINRFYTWDNPDQNIDTATDFTGYGVPLGLAMVSNIEGTTINASINISFENTVDTPLKLVIYLTENGLIYDQSNNTPYYGGASILVDFEHNDVLRAIVTHHLGESIPEVETVTDNIYTVQKQIAIPATVEDNEKLHIVAFVTNATTNEVVNVREAHVGEEQEFQILE